MSNKIAGAAFDLKLQSYENNNGRRAQVESLLAGAAALNRLIPFKPKYPKNGFGSPLCPECGAELTAKSDKFCYSCGQAIDWNI